MKKIIFGAAMMLASVAAMAQGYVGGGIGLTYNTDAEATEFTIAPEVGYNFSEKWAAGVALEYSHISGGGTVNVFEIAPYARYKFFNHDRVHLFVDGGFDLAIGDGDGDTVFMYQIGFKPGVAFDVTERFGLVAHFGFLGYQGANDAGSSVFPEKVGFDFSSSNLQFGFYVNF